MMSKCSKNNGFLFLPYFDIICDLLLNICMGTWNLFVNQIPPSKKKVPVPFLFFLFFFVFGPQLLVAYCLLGLSYYAVFLSESV